MSEIFRMLKAISLLVNNESGASLKLVDANDAVCLYGFYPIFTDGLVKPKAYC
jgi:hypothetical protein